MKSKLKRLLPVLLGAVAATAAIAFFMPKNIPPLDQSVKADKILVEKKLRRLTVYEGDQVIAVYPIGLGFEPVGPKRQEGDGKTPEGKYRINYKNPHSAYYLSLKISYPDRQDEQNARQNGVKPGGDIMIHGYPNFVPGWVGDLVLKGRDWTEGCIAVSNAEIENLWRLVETGTPIEILP